MSSERRWKRIAGCRGSYEVSNLGEVRNATTGRVLKDFDPGNGYRVIDICVPGGSRKFRVHRLVASAFIRPPKKGEEVNHIDFDRTNNRLDNLEWVTRSENIRHQQSRPSYFLMHRRKKNPAKKLFDRHLAEIVREIDAGERKINLARKYGVHPRTLRLRLSKYRASAPHSQTERGW